MPPHPPYVMPSPTIPAPSPVSSLKKTSSRIPIIDPTTGEEVHIGGGGAKPAATPVPAAAATTPPSSTAPHPSPLASGLAQGYNKPFVPSKQASAAIPIVSPTKTEGTFLYLFAMLRY